MVTPQKRHTETNSNMILYYDFIGHTTHQSKNGRLGLGVHGRAEVPLTSNLTPWAMRAGAKPIVIIRIRTCSASDSKHIRTFCMCPFTNPHGIIGTRSNEG
ncbi:unnamed protein product [Allacma fusca]|uniref:Uncharacterized protein n=1 Tax=Allacma fusca TaxID=39272 RepID=A0A8J2PMD1_9HEXA|nr:unnamed protein product [Allacma fusca]